MGMVERSAGWSRARRARFSRQVLETHMQWSTSDSTKRITCCVLVLGLGLGVALKREWNEWTHDGPI